MNTPNTSSTNQQANGSSNDQQQNRPGQQAGTGQREGSSNQPQGDKDKNDERR